MNGVDVPTGTISQLRSLSADGLTIAGILKPTPSTAVGFVATIPTPATALLTVGIVFVVPRRRR